MSIVGLMTEVAGDGLVQSHSLASSLLMGMVRLRLLDVTTASPPLSLHFRRKQHKFQISNLSC